MDPWTSRSAVLSSKASVSCDQPLASNAGLDILKAGGNAADAVIAMAAVVSLIQPMLCGLGGDVNFMFHRSSDKKVFSINGSGRTGKNATLDKLYAAGILSANDVPDSKSALWISVPGAVAALFEIYTHFGSGKLSMRQLLDPAIRLAEGGAPVPYKAATLWNDFADNIRTSRHAQSLLKEDGSAPSAGEVIYAPELAQFFKDLTTYGPGIFYEGSIAERIVDEVQYAGGVLTMEDMRHHFYSKGSRQPTEPLFVYFQGFHVWEMRPSTTGVVALVAFNILNGIDLKAYEHNSADYIHIVAESLKLSVLECWDFLADPNFVQGSLDDLLSSETADRLRNRIDMNRAIDSNKTIAGEDTSYLAAVDEEGNGASFIFSLSESFGSGQIPRNSGFALHNRAKSMALDKDSPNAYAPRKFPLHTIIPAMLTNSETGDLEAVFGVMGVWMQPQGHVQVLLNMVIFGMDPQAALNQARFRIGDFTAYSQERETLGTLYLEEGIEPSTADILRSKGHIVPETMATRSERESMGRGHVIARPTVFNPDAANPRQVWWAGTDPRTDGAAMGY